jgi:hypothetical protein
MCNLAIPDGNRNGICGAGLGPALLPSKVSGGVSHQITATNHEDKVVALYWLRTSLQNLNNQDAMRTHASSKADVDHAYHMAVI